jgi:hypothetical protein
MLIAPMVSALGGEALAVAGCSKCSTAVPAGKTRQSTE